MSSLSLLIKPASGSCNIRCRYCFYRDEQQNRDTYSYGMMTGPPLRHPGMLLRLPGGRTDRKGPRLL